MIHELAICNVDQLESCDNLKMYDILVTMKVSFNFFFFDNLSTKKLFSDNGLFLVPTYNQSSLTLTLYSKSARLVGSILGLAN